jgi:hypothetical protein
MTMMTQYARLTAAEVAHLRRLVIVDPNGAFDFVDELSSDWPDRAPIARRTGYGTEHEWAGLRYLLDRAGPPPVDVIAGGTRLTDDEWGYEPPRLLTPAEVAEGARYLRATPFAALERHFDPGAMADVYPRSWSSESLAALRGGYRDLVDFVGGAADAGHAIVVWLT